MTAAEREAIAEAARRHARESRAAQGLPPTVLAGDPESLSGLVVADANVDPGAHSRGTLTNPRVGERPRITPDATEGRMPYKDPAQQREFARLWAAARRKKYTAGMRCVDCGTTQNLEMDHRDQADKESHRIWTWSEKRLLAELAKCDPRCHDCHVKRHQADRPAHGETGYKKGCRCDVCRAAKAASYRRYHARVNERQAA